jgi:putative transposase
LLSPTHEQLLVGDGCTVTKAGFLTHGIGRFFSGILGQVVKGLEFFVLSLADVTRRKAYPLSVKQTVRSEAEKAAIKRRQKKRAKKPKNVPKKPRGRHKGSPNKDKNELKLSAELLRINEMLAGLLKLLRNSAAISYLALDGHFGHNQAVLMARANDLHLISKLRRDAALFEKYKGEQSGRGPKRKYGTRLDYDKIPQKYWKKSERQGEILTNYYEGIFLHKEFGCELKIVIIEKINVGTKKVGHIIRVQQRFGIGLGKVG